MLVEYGSATEEIGASGAATDVVLYTLFILSFDMHMVHASILSAQRQSSLYSIP